MTGIEQDRLRADGPSVIVAGHICLDVIPSLPPGSRRRSPEPGSLLPLGPVTLSVGGCVGNTGIALHRLGLRPSLVAHVGDDRLGGVLADLLHDAVPEDAAQLRVIPGGSTSYSLITNRPREDRAIQHHPGVNATFVADDVPDDLLQGAALLHVGYPPLMAAMVADDGRELRRLLVRARALGLTTSVDMASVGRGFGPDRISWRTLLERVLPEVDVFMPSLTEAAHLLGRRIRRAELGAPRLASVAAMAGELVEMGVAVAGIKLGADGLYVRTAPTARLAAASGGIPAGWAGRELYSTVFETQVVGTTGAGDSTIAGFLFGLLSGMPLDAAITAACAVGGSSTEASDGTSGVMSWPRIERRLEAGWRRREASPGAGWAPSGEPGLYRGPRDAVGSNA